MLLLTVKPEHLKTWRRKHGYTQLALARALRVIPITVSRWERGVRETPSFLHLALEALERRGGEKKPRDRVKKKKTRKEVKAHG